MSYSTGSDPDLRQPVPAAAAHKPRASGHEYNDAEVGAQRIDLFWEMSLAVWQKADVVTVLIGANDACTTTVGQMTPVATSRNSINEAFGLFFSNRPGARIVLSSIPEHLPGVAGRPHQPRASMIWQASVSLPVDAEQSDLDSAPADQLRRDFVSLQIAKYNAALASVCAQYRGCRWDGGALWRYPFQLSQLSSLRLLPPERARASARCRACVRRTHVPTASESAEPAQQLPAR